MIQLSEKEIELGRWLGEQRFAYRRDNGIPSHYMGGKKPIDIDILGATGEVAFYKQYRLDMGQLTFDTAKHDALICDKRIDVKTIDIPGNLFVPQRCAHHGEFIDLYCLMQQKSVGWFMEVGWFPAREVFTFARLKDIKGCSTYVVSRIELLPRVEVFHAA